MADFSIHESSYVDDGCEIGAGTKIWHFSHVMAGESGAAATSARTSSAGRGCRRQREDPEQRVALHRCRARERLLRALDGVHERGHAAGHVSRKHGIRRRSWKRGATLGANSTIVSATPSRCAFIGAANRHERASYALVVGQRTTSGWMCSCGRKARVGSRAAGGQPARRAARASSRWFRPGSPLKSGIDRIMPAANSISTLSRVTAARASGSRTIRYRCSSSTTNGCRRLGRGISRALSNYPEEEQFLQVVAPETCGRKMLSVGSVSAADLTHRQRKRHARTSSTRIVGHRRVARQDLRVGDLRGIRRIFRTLRRSVRYRVHLRLLDAHADRRAA